MTERTISSVTRLGDGRMAGHPAKCHPVEMRAKFRALLVGTGLVAAMASGAEIRGTVTGEGGAPIEGAMVMGDSLGRAVLTGADGEYRVTESGGVISFRKDGFRPLTILVNGRTNVDAVLRRGGPEWIVQDCAASFAPTLLVDPTMHVLLRAAPPISDEPGYRDIDYSGRVLSFQSKEKKFYLRTMVGPSCCGPGPSPKRYAKSRSFEEREWAYGRLHGLDARGVGPDGTRWRWVGPMIGWMIVYEGASEEAATVFDRAIDSMCVGK